jgi:antirestriction protein ArdC
MAIGRDLYATVTNRIVAELENGFAPWVKPWSRSIKGGVSIALPYNASTRKPYRGINILLLGMLPGFEVPAYVTFQQAKMAGGTVRKGEHGHKIYFYMPLTVKDKTNGEDKKIPMLKEYTVFNVSQCDGLPTEYYGKRDDLEPVPPSPVDAPSPEFSAWVARSGARVQHGGNKAFYSPGYDLVQMPVLAAFKNAAGYSATLAHELVHWTGAKKRCDRVFGKRFGDQAYAAEELVAELGAAFTCAHFGIEGDLRHAGYIASWIKLLKSDSRAIFTAASKAQQAVDYLMADHTAVTADDEEQAALAA